MKIGVICNGKVDEIEADLISTRVDGPFFLVHVYNQPEGEDDPLCSTLIQTRMYPISGISKVVKDY